MPPLDLRNPTIRQAYESGKERGLAGKDPSQGFFDISSEETFARNAGYHEGVRLRDLEQAVGRGATESPSAQRESEDAREANRRMEERLRELQERDEERYQQERERAEEEAEEDREFQEEMYERLREEQEERAAESDYKAANPGDYQCPKCLFITLKRNAQTCCKCHRDVPDDYWPEVDRKEQEERRKFEEAQRVYEEQRRQEALAWQAKREAEQRAEEERKAEAAREWKRKEPERQAAALEAAAKEAAWPGARRRLLLSVSCYGLLFGVGAALARAVTPVRLTLEGNVGLFEKPMALALILLGGVALALTGTTVISRAVAKNLRNRLNG